MTLSIITVNLNNNDGLKKTITSVLSQSFRDFEYIIVDGASTDNSVNTIRSLIDGDEVVPSIWISEPDSGIYNAMNKGIKYSSGDYLLFLNSGDYLINNEAIFNVFKEPQTAEILCARCRVSENERIVWTSPIVPKTITLGWIYWNGIMHQSTFIKRTLFDRVGFYDESFRWLADIQFWYKAFIYNDATSQPIDVITTDYNHEGISSTTKGNVLFYNEAHWPDTQPVLRHIMPDFKDWEKDKSIAAEIGWIKQHPILLRFLSLYRKFLNKINK